MGGNGPVTAGHLARGVPVHELLVPFRPTIRATQRKTDAKMPPRVAARSAEVIGAKTVASRTVIGTPLRPGRKGEQRGDGEEHFEEAHHRRMERGPMRRHRGQKPARPFPAVSRATPAVDRAFGLSGLPRRGQFARRPPDQDQKHQEPTEPTHGPPRKPSSPRLERAGVQLRDRPQGGEGTPARKAFRRLELWAPEIAGATAATWRPGNKVPAGDVAFRPRCSGGGLTSVCLAPFMA
jgi:hypothetical protein